MDVNDDAGILNVRGAVTFFASRLAPTCVCLYQAFGKPIPWPICTGEPAASSSAHFT